MGKYNMINAWVHAIRPRTLPLALSGIIAGSFIAAADGRFHPVVFILASTTALLLQVLSNLANDYGDFVKGTDMISRTGPKRALQSGMVKPTAMLTAIAMVSMLALLSGSLLIFEGTKGNSPGVKMGFFLTGSLALVAAITYTMGKKPFGYMGFGDLAVFIFFGLAGVIGTYYLHTHAFRWDILLPATSVGLLSAGVININNIRDYQNDMKAGKRTFVVLVGSRWSKIYHIVLISAALVAGCIYTWINYTSNYQWLFLLTVPLFTGNIYTIYHHKQPIELNTELKKLAFSTLVFSLVFGVGLVI